MVPTLPTDEGSRPAPRTRRLIALSLVLCALSSLMLLGAADGEPTPATQETTEATGPIAAGLAKVLAGEGPYATPDLDVRLISQAGDILDLDKLMGEGLTLLFYFSASCPHCSLVAPEVVRLSQRLGDSLTILGIASGSNGLDAIGRFQDAQKLPFPVHKDFSRRFASRNQAVSTPTVLLIRKKADGGFETLEHYRPFYSGASLATEIRIRTFLGQDPWQAFEPGRYHGAKACGSCHREEYRSWQLTHHSNAYWTLYERKESSRAECVKCHVTGLGQSTGFELGDDGSPLADVTCEACHGPAGPHAPGHNRADTPPASASCTQCHDPEHSVRFDLGRALPAIDHFRTTNMDEATFQQGRRDLLEGRAPKPLLAFPEGQNLGPSKCVECHRTEQRHWSRSGHARAMKTLSQKGAANNMECVPCHAVAKTESPTKAKDFHDDGVSCEACHGPGEQHVAAGGGKDNIVGLGETCPECVIEGICTRCHTPEQDPDWELDSALDKVRHAR
ncbi:MAG TPA: hypothetical protein DIU15_04020 [Deltaproteobacteria bacterium]|nr:hypothetical protein [Deltaproteobacteria bacterium]HCP45181.1 hypothetical protein [Deltaproteobacteria bacterium]